MAVKLRKPIEISDDDTIPETPRSIPLRPLAVTGVVITRATMIEAMRIYLPALIDLEVVEDGERFLLTLAAPADPTDA